MDVLDARTSRFVLKHDLRSPEYKGVLCPAVGH